MKEAFGLLWRWQSMLAFLLLCLSRIPQYFLLSAQPGSLGALEVFLIAAIPILVMVAVFWLLPRGIAGCRWSDLEKPVLLWIGLFIGYQIALQVMTFLLVQFHLNLGGVLLARSIALVVGTVWALTLFPVLVKLMSLAAPFAGPSLGQIFKIFWTKNLALFVWPFVLTMVPKLFHFIMNPGAGVAVTYGHLLLETLVTASTGLLYYLLALAIARKLSEEQEATANVFD